MTLPDRLTRHIHVEPNTGCWLWLGSVNCRTGYGMLRAPRAAGGKNFYAHRLAYEAAKGPIPAGLHIDHLCRQRCCVNPDHLEAVTCKENTWGRGVGPRHVAYRTGTCGVCGSTKVRQPSGAMCCKTCARVTNERIAEQRKAARHAAREARRPELEAARAAARCKHCGGPLVEAWGKRVCRPCSRIANNRATRKYKAARREARS